MGMVYSAVHELTGRRVALKLMLSDSDEAPLLHDRFLSEARIAAAVRHPNIVDVLDMGLHGGAPFLVMELLEGRSLDQVLQTQQRLSVEQALMWMFPIIGALSVLHEAGIVHRDVKPSNIFMSSLPRHPMRPKLLDFGLARVISDLRLTRSGTVIGTPLYMAPEHAAGYVTGPQADVWSIGVVLYETLTGRSPFNYMDRSSLALQVLAGLVRPLAEVRPDLPTPICDVVGRTLQRDLTRRYADMHALAQALHAAARASNIPVPADPDPIGLPNYVRWQSQAQNFAITQEVSAPRAATTSPSEAPGWSAGSAPGSTPGSVPPSDSASRPAPSGQLERTAPTRSRNWWWLLPVLLLCAAGLLWRRLRNEQGPVPTPGEASIEARDPPATGATPRAPALVRPELRPIVESLAPSPSKASVPVQTDKPAAPLTQKPSTATGAPSSSSKRRSSADRPAMPRAPVSAPKKPTPEPSPDEVESEWK
ncbi:MAG: serine/threonine protein kinase [Myxococcaceae bacterium]|nr:serine/threonine protein kinase [Myxococcaceae bacterium]